MHYSCSPLVFCIRKVTLDLHAESSNSCNIPHAIKNGRSYLLLMPPVSLILGCQSPFFASPASGLSRYAGTVMRFLSRVRSGRCTIINRPDLSMILRCTLTQFSPCPTCLHNSCVVKYPSRSLIFCPSNALTNSANAKSGLGFIASVFAFKIRLHSSTPRQCRMVIQQRTRS